MYDALGVHWAAALPGFVALACIPFMVIFWKYGAKIRAKCKYSADAERQMNAIIAARMAQMQAAKDEESTIGGHSASTVAPPNVGDKTQAMGGATEGEKAVQSQPAEQFGGSGTTEAAALDAQGFSQEEFAMYEALADRDEVDLSDDERMRLAGLHEKFNYSKAKN